MTEDSPFIFWSKRVTRFVVGMGASTITGQIISRNVDTENVVQEVSVFTTSVVAGYAASEYAGKYTDRKIDEIVAWYQEIRNDIKELQANKS